MAQSEKDILMLAEKLKEKFSCEQQQKELETAIQETAISKFNEEHGTSLSLSDYKKLNSMINKEKKEQKETLEEAKSKVDMALREVYDALSDVTSYMTEAKEGEFEMDLPKIAKVKYKPLPPYLASESINSNQELHDQIVEMLALEMGDYSCLKIDEAAYIALNQSRAGLLKDLDMEVQNLPGIIDRKGIKKEEVSIYKKRS